MTGLLETAKVRVSVRGAVVFDDNVLADPDGNELVSSSIRGSLGCSASSPAAPVGDAGGGQPERRDR